MSNPFLESAFTPPKPFRKRRPLLFWGGLLLLAIVAFNVVQALRNGPLRGPVVGVIRVEGMILSSDAVTAFADTLRQDPKVKAVVVRINSPGGGVGASQEIYQAVKRLAAVKPVIISMSSTAASGGYYIAVAGKEIYAMPSTLTASIGVKLQVPNAEALMHTIGLSSKTLTTGALKDAGTYTRDMTPEEEAYFQALIDDMYNEFIKTVAQGRKMPETDIRALADGRAMTGRQAMEAGLVDSMGDFYEALTRAADLGGIPKDEQPELWEGPERPNSLLRDLIRSVMQVGAEQQAELSQARFFY